MSLTYAPGVPPIPITSGRIATASLASAAGAGTAVNFATAFRSGDAVLDLVAAAGNINKIKALALTNCAEAGYILLQFDETEDGAGDPDGYPLFAGATITLYPYDVGCSLHLVDATATSATVKAIAVWE